MISSEFLCECKKMKGWVTEGKVTKPCPFCCKKYRGVYNNKKLTIEAIKE